MDDESILFDPFSLRVQRLRRRLPADAAAVVHRRRRSIAAADFGESRL
jgi:hypothetical protein